MNVPRGNQVNGNNSSTIKIFYCLVVDTRTDQFKRCQRKYSIFVFTSCIQLFVLDVEERYKIDK